METFAYARVSFKDQNLERQLDAFRKCGIKEDHIFCDKVSGKDFNRKFYLSLVGTDTVAPRLREGDMLVIYSIDRLGRNYTEILNEWKRITQQLKCDIKVLDMPLINTRGEDGKNLDRKFVSDLVLQILSYVSEKERSSIKKNQKAGIDCMPIINGKKHSIKTGRPIGRPCATYPENWEVVYSKWLNKEITGVQAFHQLGLKKSTFYTLVKKYQNKN